MDDFREGYEYFVKNCDAAAAAQQASEDMEWVPKVETEIAALESDLANFETSGKTIDTLSGDLAECWHVRTFNMDSLRNGSSHEAWAPRSHDFASPDIETNYGAKAQVKYYRNGEAAAKAQAVSFDQAARHQPAAQCALDQAGIDPNDPIYKKMVRLIADGQFDEARDSLERKIAKEQATRPEQVKRYKDALDHLDTVLRDDQGNSSKPLTRMESKQLALDTKNGRFDPAKYGLTPAQFTSIKETLQSSVKAGMTAAMISAALSAAPAVLETIEHLIRTGEIDLELLKSGSSDAVAGGAHGFLIGSVAAAVTETARIGLLGGAVKALDSSVIGAVSVIAIDMLENSIKVASGQMESAELVDRLMRDLFVSTCSLVAGFVGQAMLIELPIFGYLIGSFVGSTFAGLLYSAGERLFVSLCVEQGLVVFGLVDQDYELPAAMLKEAGLDVFEFDELNLDGGEKEDSAFDEFSFDVFTPSTIQMTVVKRGLISVSRVGYIA
ncbi:MAG: hypothetical protein PHR15_06455 [Atopobiaceae bacterium]|jgi:hypothetical protein|nr:hypothetical protein [Atopobiaceae bacterium]MCH4180703.1 hypothetical protein [Atopobiaceae bacterium]MCH4214720.1 hypothetical protein [Atopobiaceae bacterium]MCH4276766.1 hypothetical protein [Atopobiaceae bacterium]MCI1226586.1 hypothetical protein [Atopobiaceae bacterium]